MPKKKSEPKASAPAAPAVPDRHAAIDAAVNPPAAPAAQAYVTPLAELRRLKPDALADAARTAAATVCSAHVLTGKILCVMDEQRGDKGTLASYARAQTGIEIDPSAYKAAVAFGMVGVGHGHCAESDYDGCRLRWLISVSKILNTLAKEKDETFVAKTREAVAEVMRARKENAGKLLEAIYKAVKPEKVPDDDGAGDDDGDDDEGNTPAAREHGLLKIPAFSREWYKAILHTLDGITDPEVLKMAHGSFSALSTVAAERMEQFQPAALAAAA